MTPLTFAILAAFGNLAGAFIVVRHERAELKLVERFIAFGAGFMVATVVLGMLPEAFGSPDAAYYVLGGYLAVHLAQHVFTPHFHFGEETHRLSPAAGMSALAGLSLHTFFDGVAIASGFLVSGRLGLLLFLAVLLHKLPEGVTIASVMLAGGQRRRTAVIAAATLGAATVLGVIVTDSMQPLVRHGLALSAGVTLYVAASDLLPEFQSKRGWSTPLAFFGGAGSFIATRLILAQWLA